MSVGLSIRSEIATHTVQAVSDDILYIQSQNRGLQVQTQNLRALLGEIENLLVRPSCRDSKSWITHARNSKRSTSRKKR